MKKIIENKIRLNAAILYIIVVVGCFFMVLYFFNLHKNISKQKEEIERYNRSLTITNHLISKVSEVQSHTAEYLSTKEISYSKKIKQNLSDIKLIIDSLHTHTKLQSQDSILKEIIPLLNKKTSIVSKIIVQLNKNNPIDPLHEKLRDYEPISDIGTDSLEIIHTTLDTIIKISPKKGFFQELSGLFSSEQTPDTTITIRTSTIDTLRLTKKDSLSILSEVSGFVDKAGKGYEKNIKEIRSQVKSLIITEQSISSQLSSLLLLLYRETINSTLKEVEKSQELIKKHYQWAIIAGSISLILSLIFVILIVRNTSRTYRARLALEDANKRNRQIMESRHKLLLSVSHDIKTPLSTILGNVELFHNKRKEVKTIQNAGKHILALLDNLLEFSRMEQGEGQLTYSNFKLIDLLEELLEMFEPLAKHKNLLFNSKFEFTNDLEIHSDSLKIKQILINLISNAIKYTHEGEVFLSADYKDKKLHFIISDSGIGIPPKEQEGIFKPFLRAKNSHLVAEGSGLGLYVVKGLIELLGGTIKLTSHPNKGTKVEVEIPIETVNTPMSKKLKHIFLIDDDHSFLNVVSSMLLELGHELTTCSQAEDFERLSADANKYDAVLTDMEMTSFSGVDVLKKMKTLRPEIPVFLMSARSENINNLLPEKLEFDAYLQKPITISTLQQIFGSTKKIDCRFQGLKKMFEDDEESIKEIMELFVKSTIENIAKLQEARKKNKFREAQSICHKMLAMFAQLEVEEAVVILKKMDALRGAKPEEFPEWKKEIDRLIQYAKELIVELDKS